MSILINPLKSYNNFSLLDSKNKLIKNIFLFTLLSINLNITIDILWKNTFCNIEKYLDTLAFFRGSCGVRFLSKT